MATLESALSLKAFASLRCCNKHCLSPKPLDSIKLNVSASLFPLSQISVFSPSHSPTISTSMLCFELCSALQEAPTEEQTQDQTQEPNIKKKLYVFNLPWALSAVDIKNLFGQCGTVIDVEIIKSKNGRSRGFAFVTMASGEEAQAVIDKFDSHELSGRIIRVELAKRFKKPPPPRPPSPPAVESRHIIYASNLAWKARSTHLREFFTQNFKAPVSARVVFDSPSGRSAGYGFVSFPTKDEAEAAISSLDGKELMGRPLRLKFSEKNVEESGNEKEEEQGDDGQLQES